MVHYYPNIPEQSFETRLFTYQDAVEAVLDRFGRINTGEGRDLRTARDAVQSAYDMIYRTSFHEWNWYKRIMHITLSASYSTGTITYDHTGSSNERELTLASGTWPSDANYGLVEISDKFYYVDQRISDTIITLREDSNPGADVAAGSSYWWIREAYPLPPDFHALRTPLDSERGSSAANIEPTDMESVIAYTRTQGETTSSTDAYLYAIGSDQRVAGNCLFVAPALTGSRNLEIPYQAMGRPLSTYLLENGTVASTDGSATITGTSTAFADKHVGGVFRASDSAAKSPTSQRGNTDDEFNPAAFTRLVKSVASVTSLTLDDEADQTLSGVKFTISSPVDIDVPLMRTAFLRLAEYYFVVNSPELNTEANYGKRAFESAMMECSMAQEADNRQRSVPPSSVWSGAGWFPSFASTAALAAGVG